MAILEDDWHPSPAFHWPGDIHITARGGHRRTALRPHRGHVRAQARLGVACLMLAAEPAAAITSILGLVAPLMLLPKPRARASKRSLR